LSADDSLATGIVSLSKLPLQQGVVTTLGLALAGGSDSPFPEKGIFIADIAAGRCERRISFIPAIFFRMLSASSSHDPQPLCCFSSMPSVVRLPQQSHRCALGSACWLSTTFRSSKRSTGRRWPF
jgi:hypothetical protein